MALFKKKEQTKSKVDQAVELFNSFTDEEFDEFLHRTDLDGDGNVDETDAETETETESEVENTETTETEETVEGETEAQAEAETEAEVEQPMQEETPEQEPENAPEQPQEQPQENVDEKPQDADRFHSLEQQINNLKDLVASVVARLDADKENEADNKQEFGIGMNSAGKEADGQSDLDRAKAKYWSF